MVKNSKVAIWVILIQGLSWGYNPSFGQSCSHLKEWRISFQHTHMDDGRWLQFFDIWASSIGLLNIGKQALPQSNPFLLFLLWENERRKEAHPSQNPVSQNLMLGMPYHAIISLCHRDQPWYNVDGDYTVVNTRRQRLLGAILQALC